MMNADELHQRMMDLAKRIVKRKRRAVYIHDVAADEKHILVAVIPEAEERDDADPQKWETIGDLTNNDPKAIVIDCGQRIACRTAEDMAKPIPWLNGENVSERFVEARIRELNRQATALFGG